MAEYKWLDEVFNTLDELDEYARRIALRSMQRKIKTARMTALLELQEAKCKDLSGNSNDDQILSSVQTNEPRTFMIWDAASQSSKIVSH